MNNKLILLVVVIFIVGGLFLLYTQPKEEEKELEKVVVMMPFITQIQWAAYYTAQYKGFYEEEGLDVEIQYSTKGSGGPIEQLVGNQVDFVLTGTENVVMSKTQGIDTIAIYPIEPANAFYVISEKDKNITTIPDLRGKTIGIISSASGSYKNLQVMLSLFNMTVNDVEIIFAGTAVVPSFLEGQFDAAAVHLSQKTIVDEEIPDLNIIEAGDYVNISWGHMVTMKQTVEDRPDTVRRFLRATKKGLEYAINNPEEAVDIFAILFPEAGSQKELNLEKWNNFIENYGYDERLPESESEAYWRSAQDMLYNIGIIDSKIDPSLFYTNEFAP